MREDDELTGYELIPKRDGERSQPGPWWWPLLDAGKVNATIKCSGCGVVATLSDHTIHADGRVTPSLLCPTEGCGVHAFVRLQLWQNPTDP
jgi:hypothetical protein